MYHQIKLELFQHYCVNFSYKRREKTMFFTQKFFSTAFNPYEPQGGGGGWWYQ